MVAYTKQRLEQALAVVFFRFCIVGAWGFALNFAILTTLYKEIGLSLFLSQLIAGEIALFNNFMLHHHWTYKGHNVKKAFLDLLILFHGTSWVAIIGTAFIVSASVHYLQLNYIISLFIAGAVALVWNYMWSKLVIWKSHGNISSHTKLVEKTQ